MTAWNIVRRETAGAWRSVRYDLDRRAEARPAARPARADGGARRLVGAAGVGLLVAGGLAGTYFTVAGGLGLLGADTALLGPGPGAAPPAVALASGTPESAQPHPAPPRPARSGRPAGRRVAGSATSRPGPAAVVAAPATDVPSVPPHAPAPESTSTPSGAPTPSPSPCPTPAPSAAKVNEQGQPAAGH